MRLIVPHLTVARRGFTCRTSFANVINAILYKFRTGCQWRLLPISALIPGAKIKHGAVYHHFRKWTLDGSWKRVKKQLVRHNPGLLDLSIAHFDGTHARVQRGGENTGYQGRKKSMTTNTFCLTDRSGLVVSYIPPVAGNYNDLYKIEQSFKYLINDLKDMGLSRWSVYKCRCRLAGFDARVLSDLCELHGIHLNTPINPRSRPVGEFDQPYFDELMYQERFVVERTNA